MPTLLSLSMRLPAICEELLPEDVEPPTTAPAPPRPPKKKVRFSLQDQVYTIGDTDEGTLDTDSLR